MVFQTRSGFQLLESPALDDASHANGRFGSIGQFRMRVASQPFSSLGPFATISSNILRSVGSAGSSSNVRKENATEFEFLTELCHKTKPCPSLAGLGVRAKKILGIKNINIYALGIYVDCPSAKKALASHYKASTQEGLSQDQKLFDDVINGNFEKSLCLVISYGSLKRGQFLDALQERLAPRLNQAGEPGTLDVFRKQFDDVNFKKGTEIVFVQEGSKLVTKIDGQQKGAISSSSLCRSLFDIYLGSDPVAPDAKNTFGKSLAAVLKE